MNINDAHWLYLQHDTIQSFKKIVYEQSLCIGWVLKEL